MEHADYPHTPGTLYDCAACEARCHCRPGETLCVFCGTLPPEKVDLRRFEAVINVPGFLPVGDPMIFDTMTEAWLWLREQRERDLDDPMNDEDDDQDDQALDEIEGLIDAPETGVVYGRTPGYFGDHDQGLAYSVREHDCPGMECPDFWHLHGCLPYWQYCAAGYDITDQVHRERDADEMRLWRGPDGPDMVYRKVNGAWEGES